MPKPRKLDATAEQQAIAFARKLIELRGGLSHGRELWRAARKYELCGQLELPEEVVAKFKEMSSQLAQVEARLGPIRPSEEAATGLIADAERGNPDADQVLREATAEYLKRGELPPKPLANYAATCLQAHPGRKKQRPSQGKRSLKTASRNRHLALIVYAVSRKFGLNANRNRDPKNTKNDYRPDCGCSIVAKAINKSESTVRQVWEQNQDFGHRDLVAELIELKHDLDQVMSGLKRYDQQVAAGVGHDEAVLDVIHFLLKATWKLWESDHRTKREGLISSVIYHLDDLSKISDRHTEQVPIRARTGA